MIHDAQLDYYGRRLATCSSDKTIKLYEVVGNTSTFITQLTRHKGPVWEVAWAHPKFGSILASCSFDHTVIVWKETAAGVWEPVHEHAGHEASVNSIAWAPHECDLPILACGSSDGTVSILTFQDGKWITEFLKNAHATSVNAVSWSLDKPGPSAPGVPTRLLATGGCDNLVKVWRFEGGRTAGAAPEILAHHTDWVRDVAWAPTLGLTPPTIASCSQDGHVYMWTFTQGKWNPQEMHDFRCPVWRVSWSVSGNILAVSCSDNKVTLWKESLDGKWYCISDVDDGAQGLMQK